MSDVMDSFIHVGRLGDERGVYVLECQVCYSLTISPYRHFESHAVVPAKKLKKRTPLVLRPAAAFGRWTLARYVKKHQDA